MPLIIQTLNHNHVAEPKRISGTHGNNTGLLVYCDCLVGIFLSAMGVNVVVLLWQKESPFEHVH